MFTATSADTIKEHNIKYLGCQIDRIVGKPNLAANLSLILILIYFHILLHIPFLVLHDDSVQRK